MKNKKLKYIDLFAGIGGFHIALERLNLECVFASELSGELRDLYKVNYSMECSGDITKVDINSIPQHDLLCAGFPCQSFSKAGNQQGMQEARGKLFNEIIKILSHHRPRYFILENVRNLITHDKGYTWQYISNELKKLDYYFDFKILSPHYINIPHHRERVFVVGSSNPIDILNMKWIGRNKLTTSIEDIIDNNVQKSDLDFEKIEVLNIWSKFLKDLPFDVKPYRPLWSMEFGANYPINQDWKTLSLEDWKKYKGNFGYPLSSCKSLDDVFKHLPNYVKTQKGIPPLWKQKYIRNNRHFYETYKKFISPSTLSTIKKFNQESWKKFEWNCNNSGNNFYDKLIQFRGSGVRVKANDYIPSLVTVTTQIPILGKYNRYLNPSEGAKAQCLPEKILLPSTKSASFRVLGNMVNVELVYKIASSLLNIN